MCGDLWVNLLTTIVVYLNGNISSFQLEKNEVGMVCSILGDDVVEFLNYVPPLKGVHVYCFWCRTRRRLQSLCARHLVNLWADWNQICMNITLGMLKT